MRLGLSQFYHRRQLSTAQILFKTADPIVSSLISAGTKTSKKKRIVSSNVEFDEHIISPTGDSSVEVENTRGNLPHVQQVKTQVVPHTSAWTLAASSSLYTDTKEGNLNEIINASTLAMTGRNNIQGQNFFLEASYWPGLGPIPPRSLSFRNELDAVASIENIVDSGDVLALWTKSHQLAYENLLIPIFDTVVNYLAVNFREDEMYDWFTSVEKCVPVDSLSSSDLKMMRSGMITELIYTSRLIIASNLALKFLKDDESSLNKLLLQTLSKKIDIVFESSSKNVSFAEHNWTPSSLKNLQDANDEFKRICQGSVSFVAFESKQEKSKVDPAIDSILELSFPQISFDPVDNFGIKTGENSHRIQNHISKPTSKQITNLRLAVRQKLTDAKRQYSTDRSDDTQNKRWVQEVIRQIFQWTGVTERRKHKALSMLKIRFLDSMSWRNGWSNWNDILIEICTRDNHYMLGLHIFRISYGQYLPTLRMSRTKRNHKLWTEDETRILTLVSRPNRVVYPPSTESLCNLVRLQIRSATQANSREIILRFWKKMIDFDLTDKMDLPDSLRIPDYIFDSYSRSIQQVFGENTETSNRTREEYREMLRRRQTDCLELSGENV